MSALEVVVPAVIKITNLSDSAKVFAPYKENFVTAISGNGIVELKVKTSGQVLYYLGQATENLKVEILADFDGEGVQISFPETITLTNTSAKSIGFIPYKENFQFDIPAGDVVTLTASTAGQVLYYLAQATEGLSVAHEPVNEG